MIAAAMKVELLDHMGSDLDVVNAARVSFAKKSLALSSQDQKLISYLALHDHWSPFAHSFAKFRIKAPIFVARQLAKHQVGLAWNEVSRRYVDSNVEFYIPEEWRGKAPDKKQGSSDQVVMTEEDAGFIAYCQTALKYYETLLKKGVAPEMARMVLPQNMMTEWIWSGSLFAFARICKLRLDPHAQSETAVVARMMADDLSGLFPVSWKVLTQ